MAVGAGVGGGVAAVLLVLIVVVVLVCVLKKRKTSRPWSEDYKSQSASIMCTNSLLFLLGLLDGSNLSHASAGKSPGSELPQYATVDLSSKSYSCDHSVTYKGV